MEAIRQFAAHSQSEDVARIVGFGLAWFAQRDTNLAWPSDVELMAFTRRSKRTVAKALRQLERSGEIQKQDRDKLRPIFDAMDRPVPRRVYLLDPQAAGQLSLITAEGAPVCTLDPGDERAVSGLERAPHAGAGSNQQNQQQDPPNPPEGGNAQAPDLLRRLRPAGQTPRVSARVEREAPSRRRRRRREVVVPAAPGRCPLHEPTDRAASGREALEERWDPLADALRERIGAERYAVWFADAHLHATEPVVQLAVAPERLLWVADRYERVIATVVGVDVELVACTTPVGVTA